MAEDHPQQPINPYGKSKLMVEQILKDYDETYGIRHVSLRYFNTAGADPEGEIGEWHDPEPHLIPLSLQAAAGQREHIQIYGTDYDTPDGTCIRDYIHINDLAAAHLLALE
jgi:UDP-glucose 4-epimerase